MPLDSILVSGFVVLVMLVFALVLAYGDWVTHRSNWRRD